MNFRHRCRRITISRATTMSDVNDKMFNVVTGGKKKINCVQSVGKKSLAEPKAECEGQ